MVDGFIWIDYMIFGADNGQTIFYNSDCGKVKVKLKPYFMLNNYVGTNIDKCELILEKVRLQLVGIWLSGKIHIRIQ